MKKLFVISLAIMMLALNSMVYAEQNIEWNLTPSDWATEDVRRADELGILPDKISGYVNAMPRENFCDILYGLLCKITAGEIEKIDALMCLWILIKLVLITWQLLMLLMVLKKCICS